MEDLAPPRRAVLFNLAFNLGLGREDSRKGEGLSGFRRMLAALRQGDSAAAAGEMLDSRWAKQVGRRATELARQMASGQWESAGEKA
jgi:lysozyme